MQNFSNFKWVFSWSFIVHVCGSILRFFLRFFSENFVEKGSILNDFCDNKEMDCDQIEEKEVETVYYTSNTSKYLSSTGNSVCAFIEEPQNMQFRVQEIFMISPNNSSPKKDDTSFEVISGQCSVDFDNHSFNHDLRVDFCSLDYNDCNELSEEMGVKQDEMIDQKDEIIEKKEFCDEVHSCISNSDDFWAIIHEYDCFLDKNDELDSCFDEILDEKVNYDQDNPMMIEDSRNNVEENLTKDEISNNDEEVSRNNVEENLTKDEISNNDEEDDQIKTSDIIMAQRELIRQMKKEIRQLKVCGLPTILEELESPIMEEDLKPLKIDKRMGHKDRMQEIHTFYRMYLDKMKKLDILTHQTMYAIEVLQLKYQKMSSIKKVKIPVMKSFVAQNLWFKKLRKHESEPVERLITDLERELELAYVGQLCLSWEMLKWQHYKAQELHVHDPDGFYQHNLVSGEFQKFQVLLQRFTEDEPFQHASRVPHYINTRSHLPAFLQVPLIKDDPRSERGKNGEDGISIKMLKEVIASSMCTYSEFVHADKIEVSTFLLMRIQGLDQVTLQHPSDTELLTQIRSTLQKKEKRLKDLVRAGNCLVRKFQKQEDQKLSHEMMVAQVELRLVARVLSMPKLSTDQLLWCHKRLNKIHIIDRKIYIDYSFLLFPC